MRKIFQLILFGLIPILMISCGTNSTPQTNQTQNNGLTRPTPPGEYAGLMSPNMSAADLDEGKEIYRINCASCHGEKGMGDGPAAISLEPKPEPLAQTVNKLGDDYLFWRISEGGIVTPFKSAMPAWKTILKEQQIWQVIYYIRYLGG